MSGTLFCVKASFFPQEISIDAGHVTENVPLAILKLRARPGRCYVELHYGTVLGDDYVISQRDCVP